MATNKELEARVNKFSDQIDSQKQLLNKIVAKLNSMGPQSPPAAEPTAPKQPEISYVNRPKLPQSSRLVDFGFAFVAGIALVFAFLYFHSLIVGDIPEVTPSKDPITIVAQAHEDAGNNFLKLVSQIDSMEEAEVIREIPNCMGDPINHATADTVSHLQRVNAAGFDREATKETLKYLGETLLESADRLRQ